MKYINVECLGTEIERLYNGEAPKHDPQCNFDDGYFVGIDAIAQFIDSLQQEQPEVDLERDAVQFCFDKGLNITPYQAKTIARHFFNLGLNARKI